MCVTNNNVDGPRETQGTRMNPADPIQGSEAPGGASSRVLIVAELSANHRQSLDDALLIIDAARDAGADAIKLQTYTPGSLTLRTDSDVFRIHGGAWDGRLLYDLYAEASTPYEWHEALFDYARSVGLVSFSTPFDLNAVDLLEDLAVPMYKVASFEIVDMPLLKRIGSTGKPVILSTGMATSDEIEEALQTLDQAKAGMVTLLKCTSGYPAPVDDMNLLTIPDLGKRFGCSVGLSDHSLSPVVPAIATALGARVIEKHLTLSRAMPGADSSFSLEPQEFKVMAAAVREAEAALGSVQYGPSASEASSHRLRRSLFVVRDVRAGERFTAENVRSIRPAMGLHPRHLEQVLAGRAACDLVAGTPLEWAHVRLAEAER